MLNASEAKALSDKNKEPYYQGILSHQLSFVEKRIKEVSSTGGTKLSIATGIDDVSKADPNDLRLLEDIQKVLKDNGYNIDLQVSSAMTVSWDAING